ncbi:APC family permease [Pseudemcibacter aquimaris]|uniref:APC family permease n=1 Tax=Pseudemcibacter aquimaris TaxID=2857064 RepID=UPI00201346CA|nr:APC family permease [Pseudemcibacter aquimaris]MCC3862071.1 APC family permease [Pseudemcibacter aquimaris]WDU58823.1 APC family permease [Pseudemcibacter aquimaris]
MSGDINIEANEAKLKRDIGLFAAGLLVLNGVIGAGIFGLPGKLVEQAGIWGPWLIIIFGVLISSVVWTFASIASYFNTTGGPVAYANRAFGPLVGFQTGWLLYIGRVTAIGANTNVLVTYALDLASVADTEILRGFLLFLIIGGLVAINIMGVKRTVKAINLITMIKILPVLLLILLAIPYLTPDKVFPAGVPEFDQVSGLVLVILYAFVGFEGALVTAGETKNPKKTIPRALFTGIFVITAIYFLISLTYVNAVENTGGDTPLIDMGEVLMGQVGVVMIVIAAIFSILGNATAIVVAAPRMTFAMAEEGSLPAWFAKVHDKYSTPANSIMFLGVLAFLLAISGTFIYLAAASTLARMIAYIICMVSLPRIRKKADKETLENATPLPGGYLIPAIAVIVCVFAILQADIINWAYIAGFIALGSGLYFANYIFTRKSE